MLSRDEFDAAVQQAALVLKDIAGLTNMEGGNALGLTESVFRQHLSAARKEMTQKYEDLCALVNKQGVCYQCASLREGFAEDKRGSWPLESDQPLSFELRLKMVRDANIDNGNTQIMHEVFWRRTEQLEREQIGDENVETDCAKGVKLE